MNQYIYKKHTYQVDENRNYEVLSNIKKPKSIYKYYSDTGNNIDALMNVYFYCPHPYELNDPMDSSYSLWDFTNINNQQFDKFFQMMGMTKHPTYVEDKLDSFSFIIQAVYIWSSKRAGIISFSKNPLHTLMWAHYASEKGFVIELDVESFKKKLKKLNSDLKNYIFYPIQYVKDLENIDYFHNNFTTPDVPFLYSMGVKRNDWKYENEWRFVPLVDDYGVPRSKIGPFKDIPGKTVRRLYYEKKAIKSIILGKDFFIDKISDIIGDYRYRINSRSNYLGFIDFLFINFNDRLYISEEFKIGKKFKRKARKIKLHKIVKDIYEIIYFNIFY